MNVKAVFLVIGLLISWPCLSYCQKGSKSDKGITSRIATKERLEELLVCPPCLESFSRTVESYDVEEVTIPAGDIKLAGKLYPNGIPIEIR